MLALMRNGGFPMWFILGFGLVALGAAALYSRRPDPQRLAFVRGMGLATLFSTLTGTCADLATVFIRVPEMRAEIPPADLPFLLLRGLGESLSPGIVGFTLLSLTCLLVAVGGRSRLPASPLVDG